MRSPSGYVITLTIKQRPVLVKQDFFRSRLTAGFFLESFAGFFPEPSAPFFPEPFALFARVVRLRFLPESSACIFVGAVCAFFPEPSAGFPFLRRAGFFHEEKLKAEKV